MQADFAVFPDTVMLPPDRAAVGNGFVGVLNSESFMQTQCWICPHCHDDSHHQSDENGCEWQYKQDAIDAKRYRFLREVTFNQAFCSGSVHVVFMREKWHSVVLNDIDLDNAIDKAMAVQS